MFVSQHLKAILVTKIVVKTIRQFILVACGEEKLDLFSNKRDLDSIPDKPRYSIPDIPSPEL